MGNQSLHIIGKVLGHMSPTATQIYSMLTNDPIRDAMEKAQADMLNREVNSGYWDYPLNRFTNDATLLFICYFDWDSMHSRDNAYVRVQVGDWPGHPEVIGKHGLVEAHMVRYVLAEPEADEKKL